MVLMMMPTSDGDDELVLTLIANAPHAGDQVVGASERSKLEAIWKVRWWPMFSSAGALLPANITWCCINIELQTCSNLSERSVGACAAYTRVSYVQAPRAAALPQTYLI